MKNPLSEIRKNGKRFELVAAISGAVLIIIYFQFLLRPQITLLAGRISKAGKVDLDLKRAKANIARIPQMKLSVANYQKKIGLYEKVLPTEEGIPTLLEDLSNMARRSNMRIVGIVPGVRTKIQHGQTYHEMPIMVTARSGYHELGLFMNELEKSDRLMKVADVQIKANPASVKMHDVELLILTYILLENK